jgi:hypothetical protein
MWALGHEIALDVRRGRTIRSIGLAAERLYRRAESPDFAWAYDWPTTLRRNELQSAYSLAMQAVKILERHSYNHHRHELLSTFELERVHSLSKEFDADAVLQGVTDACAMRPIEGGSYVIGWHYFTTEITKAFCEAYPEFVDEEAH